MSNSYKKPIIKDKPRSKKRTPEYWRKIRRISKHALLLDKEIPNPKTIINDFDYLEDIVDYRYMDDEFDEYKEERIKYSRK